MLTGCYPARIGFDSFDGEGVLFPGQGVGLSPGETTIADILKERGYRTRIVGKWHCGDQPPFLPRAHGFDGYYGIPYSNDMGRRAGLAADEQFPPLPLLRDGRVVEEQFDQAGITARYVEDALSFIEESKSGPFFLYFAHMYVHLPLYVPDAFLAGSANGRYGAAVAAIDWSVGMIVNQLVRLGLEGDTLVVFTSDNGSRADFGPSNGPLRGIKGTTWEGGQRVPCIVTWPGEIAAGRTCSDVVTAMDLLPTLAAITEPRTAAIDSEGADGERSDGERSNRERFDGEEPGATAPRPAFGTRRIDGVDISGLLFDAVDGEARSAPERAFCYHHWGKLEAVRLGDWKLHLYKDGREVRFLFDLSADPGESRECSREYPDVVSRIEDVAHAFREDLGDTVTGTVGSGCRPIGRVAEPRPLTSYDPLYPYYAAEYDLEERG